MLANLLILLVLLVLTVGASWLTWKAARAQRLWVKIAGGLGAGLLTLVFAALTFFGGKGVATVYFPGTSPASDLTVTGTAEQIARGQYLMNISCANCHSAPGPDGMPGGGPLLSGGANLTAAEGFGFVGDIITENLTPNGKLANYSDGELFRALRHNVTQEGRRMIAMSFMPYNHLSDEDIQAIIAYIRTLPPATNEGVTGDHLNFIGLLLVGAGLFGESQPPAPDSIVAPEPGFTAQYGEYVATFGECRGCHGPNMTGKAASMILPEVPNARPFASTLSQEQFTILMRTGIKPDGTAFPPNMPWYNASKMTDDDLAALYAYLSAPVK